MAKSIEETFPSSTDVSELTVDDMASNLTFVRTYTEYVTLLAVRLDAVIAGRSEFSKRWESLDGSEQLVQVKRNTTVDYASLLREIWMLVDEMLDSRAASSSQTLLRERQLMLALIVGANTLDYVVPRGSLLMEASADDADAVPISADGTSSAPAGRAVSRPPSLPTSSPGPGLSASSSEAMPLTSASVAGAAARPADSAVSSHAGSLALQYRLRVHELERKRVLERLQQEQERQDVHRSSIESARKAAGEEQRRAAEALAAEEQRRQAAILQAAEQRRLVIKRGVSAEDDLTMMGFAEASGGGAATGLDFAGGSSNDGLLGMGGLASPMAPTPFASRQESLSNVVLEQAAALTRQASRTWMDDDDDNGGMAAP